MRSKKLDIREICEQIKFGAKRYKNNIIDVYGKKIYVRGGKDQRDASIKNMIGAQSEIDYVVVRYKNDCWHSFKKARDIGESYYVNDNEGEKWRITQYNVEDIFTKKKAIVYIKTKDDIRFIYEYENFKEYKDDEYVENGGIPKELLVLLKKNLIIDIINDKISNYRMISENIKDRSRRLGIKYYLKKLEQYIREIEIFNEYSTNKLIQISINLLEISSILENYNNRKDGLYIREYYLVLFQMITYLHLYFNLNLNKYYYISLDRYLFKIKQKSFELGLKEDFAYAFFFLFENFDKKNSDDKDNNENEDKENSEIVQLFKYYKNDNYNELYPLMCEYCRQNGNIYPISKDAIKLICKHFDENKHNDIDYISKVLSYHVIKSGNVGDIGYNFYGIDYIREYIGKLSLEMVEKIIENYKIRYFLNKPIYREQVYTIIKNFDCFKEKQKEYKFKYFDRIFLIDLYFKEKYLQEDENRNDNKYSYENESIISDFNNIKEEIEIKLIDNKISIKINGKNITTNLPEFSLDDWKLSSYDNYKLKIYKEIFELEKNKIQELYYSYVYLDGYRNIEKQELSFDNKFTYNIEKNQIYKNDNKISTKNIYAENIHSFSCIVGKNGTGKTSIIEFLSIYMRHIIDLYDSGEKLNDAIEMVLKNQTYDFKFILILTQKTKAKGLKDYIITNIEDLYYDNIEKYKTGILKNNIAFNSGIKFVHMSNKLDYNKCMLDINKEEIVNDEKDLKEKIPNEDIEKENQLVSLNNNDQSYLQLCDYSEEHEFKIKYSEYNNSNGFNRELCYQLIFLKWIYENRTDKKKIYTLLWEDFEIGNLKIITKTNMHYDIVEKNNEFIGLETIAEIIKDPYAKIEYFSSGQYAKFAFLSKLYWCFAGEKNFIILENKFDEYIKQNIDKMNKPIKAGQSAVLFIDEGEIYYHPEWQRRYVNILVKFLKEFASNVNLQVIITTNSPFMLSDFTNDCIIYLGNEDKISNKLTFGQNIHTLLVDNFFMDKTIGQLSASKINAIIEILNNHESDLSDTIKEKFHIEINNKFEFLENLINQIGEDVYRDNLLKMLYNKFYKEKKKVIIEKQIQDMNEKIKELTAELEK